MEKLHYPLAEAFWTHAFEEDWHNNVNCLVQAYAWAVWTTTPTSSPYLPSQLVFGYDMISPQKCRVDWLALK